MKTFLHKSPDASSGPTRLKTDIECESRFHATMAAIAVIVMVISAVGCYANKLTVSLSQFTPKLFLLCALLVLATMYRWRREQKCFNLVLMAFWAILLSNLHMFPMYMAARQDVEMHDALLAGIDRTIGIEVPDILEAMKRFPFLTQALDVIYNTLLLLMVTATIVPPLCNRMDKAKEYALGCTISAALSFPMFACFQAIGPWVYYEYAPNSAQSGYMKIFAELKTNTWFVIDLSNLDGLMTFPSFHTVLAVLSAIAMWQIPYARWLSGILASLIVVSTVTSGSHYLVDIIGGVFLSAIAYTGARAYVRWESGFISE